MRSRILIALCALLACLAFTASAGAAAPWWRLDSLSAPTNLAPGQSATLIVSATDLGPVEVQAAGAKVRLRDQLPADLVATSVNGAAAGLGGFTGVVAPLECSVVSGSVVECVFEGSLPSYEPLEARIGVEVLAGAKSGELNDVTVSGGGAPRASLERPITVSGEPTPFRVEEFAQEATNEDGSLDTQAGSHPYQLTTSFDLNQSAQAPYQPAMPKDLVVDLPPGLVGNPTPFPQCSDTQFTVDTGGVEFLNNCPPDTAVGVATVWVWEASVFHRLLEITSPVFNLQPSPGEPARFGFQALVAHVTLDTSVRTGGDYGVTVSSNNITQVAGFLGAQVTFWGVPGSPIHNSSRGWECVDGDLWQHYGAGPCSLNDQVSPPPLLSLPTSCTGPLKTTLSGDSWAQPGEFTPPVEPLSRPSLDGCNRLPFDPSVVVTPDGQAGSSPTGLTVGIHVPQDSLLSPVGLAESEVKNTTVVLPEGVAINPAGGDGLLACSEVQIMLSQDAAAACPEASKVATVEIHSPLLPNNLTGAAYLATQEQNPFGSLIALYVVVEDPVSGTLVKVAGEVAPNEQTGQLTSTFNNTPQLPFENFNIHFFGGSRAPLTTPAHCGSYTTTASIAPWSGNDPVEASSSFQITSGPNGSPCTTPLHFSPELTAGGTNVQAGTFSPFTMTMSREDGEQNLSSIELHMPSGLSGTLSNVKLCTEDQANEGTCGPESLIGETTVSVGVGGNPYTVTGGKVYITEKYEDAPFGLSIVNPAKAGPFDLEKTKLSSPTCDCVVVRAKIELNPTTAALTITSNPPGSRYSIPTIIGGIPLQIKHVNVTINRPEFTFNPTNCSKLSITGDLHSTEGASDELSAPFQVTNCAVLGFKPQFSVSTSGKTSRANGASLHVKLAYPKASFGSQANIKSVKVDLPKQLPSRLTTLQKACTVAQFEANPAGCPEASRIGIAKATTPLIPVPLEGPVYFVSHAGEKFPELIIVLSGYGVTVDLHSETFISKEGITSSTFRTIPDVPVGTFELTLPQGSGSALAANGNLCSVTRSVLGKRNVTVKSKNGHKKIVTRKVLKTVAGSLMMPTAFTAQSGAVIHENTPIEVTGCGRSKKAKTSRYKSKHNSREGKKK